MKRVRILSRPFRKQHLVTSVRFLTLSGNRYLVWDKNDPNQISEAELKFFQLLENMDAYRVSVSGEAVEKVLKFDSHEEIFLFKRKVSDEHNCECH